MAGMMCLNFELALTSATINPQSWLTHRLRDLVKNGLIQIAESERDGRVKNATLTDFGQQRLTEVAPSHAETDQKVIFDHLTPEQTEALADALSSIAAHLCDHEEFTQRMTGETSRSNEA